MITEISQKENLFYRTLLAFALIVLAAALRIAPHPWNFAPVGGTSLFAGARLRGWQAYAVPIVLMAVTDPLLGGYSRATPFVYLSFLINVWMGRSLRSSENPLRIGALAVVSSVQFFLLSNFGVWLGFGFPHTLAGLANCYYLGLPFYAPTLVLMSAAGLPANYFWPLVIVMGLVCTFSPRSAGCAV